MVLVRCLIRLLWFSISVLELFSVLFSVISCSGILFMFSLVVVMVLWLLLIMFMLCVLFI